MFSKAGVFALVAALSVNIHALTLNTPSDVRSGQNVTLSWTTSSGDQPFTVYLRHPSFNQDFAVANNVDPAAGSITFGLPQVNPRDNQYTFRAANITDINQTYSQTSNFAVGDPAGTSASGSGAGGATGSGTATSPPPTGTGTNSGSGTGSGTATGSGTGTGTSAGSSTTSNAPNSAVSVGVSVGAIALAALGAVGML
ncbi:hypothetical protein E1B28_002083 [Marasmius oreades]|uniref:Yeast cell wall synthesis Kre9/Knh1-like N-terminal domain-containing protein n=1 Tax=Marasmius oreades TaxID=181124 RepID=A0A9P7RM68_9AGAR|nr:uncharacterized protein E1B28_002083 [Marasmius oreades]KAG7086124.1 hypothetical protein E1B28_002083 [Marasmius oreades]